MRGRKTKTTVKRQVVGYVRVSTEDQAQSGLSLAAQRTRIEAFAVATARELDEVVIGCGRERQDAPAAWNDPNNGWRSIRFHRDGYLPET